MKHPHPLAWLAPLLLAWAALGDDPPPVISIRLAHPDGQAREVIGLFEGSKAPHPAAALAAWKRATAEPNRLGKPLEALIAAINPRMVGELGTLDAAEVALWFQPADGRLAWAASIPHDEGTFAALGTAFVLSGGRAEPAAGGLPVDRLAGPGSTLLSPGPRGVFLSATRAGLDVARLRMDAGNRDLGTPGLRVQVEPGALRRSVSPWARRLDALLGPSAGTLAASASIRGRAATSSLVAPGVRFSTRAAVDPAWLGWIPLERSSAGFALAIDPTAEAWDAAFEAADRVEKVDPARANLAPIRLRLDLLARTAAVRTEADLLPHLLGVSGWIGSDRDSPVALLAFHLDEESAAARLAERVKPLQAGGPAPGPDGARWLGRVEGRPIRLSRAGRSVAVAWGEGALEASEAARNEPNRSAGPALKAAYEPGPPACVGLLWPSRLPGLAAEGSPLASAMADSPPVRWWGRRGPGDALQLDAAWPGLDGLARRFLDRIPLDPPPDR